MSSQIPIGEIAALLGAATWSVTSLLIRSQAGRLSPLTINILRSSTAGLFSIVALAIVRPSNLAEGVPLLVVGFLMISVVAGPGLGDTLYFESLRLVGLARAMPLAGTNPIITAVLAAVVLGERVTEQMVLGTVLVVVGVALIASRGEIDEVRDFRRGILCAMGAAFLWSVSAIAVAPALRVVDTFVVNAIRLPVTALVFGFYGWRTGHLVSRKELRGRGVLAVLVSGVISGISATLFVLGVQEAGAAKTTALIATAPVFVIPLALVIYHERITPRLVLGTLGSIAGIVLVVGA